MFKRLNRGIVIISKNYSSACPSLVFDNFKWSNYSKTPFSRNIPRILMEHRNIFNTLSDIKRKALCENSSCLNPYLGGEVGFSQFPYI